MGINSGFKGLIGSERIYVFSSSV